MSTREEVYAAINRERWYQANRWGDDKPACFHSVEEFVLYMEHYLGEARRLLSTQDHEQGRLGGLDMVRKITALGVACMEQNGIVEREL